MRPAPRFNVVLVSIDTLRADHLGCYGYPRPTSPNVDAFAAGAVTFTQAIAQAPSTLHSHASMLTSLLPQHHRASWAAGTPLPDDALTLAEVLRDAGYATAAFTGGGQMHRIFGLDQGFELYEQPHAATFAATVEAAFPWLEEHAAGPFFLFLHSYETHHPYTPDPGFLAALGDDYDGALPDTISVDLLRRINAGEVRIDEADLAHIVTAYDAEIRSADAGFGALVERLRALGAWEPTMVVFTSDHGEELGERDKVGWHSHSLYDELLRVPLIIKLPHGAFAGTRVERQVRGLDLPPTVLGTLGVPSPPQFEGADLTTFLRGAPLRPLIAVSRRDEASAELTAVRTEEWKLQAGLLFHLARDPGERWSVLDVGVEAELQGALAAQVDRLDALTPATQVVPTGATLEELKALGYLQ
jgi:arylsulfatase A-like enzyme